MRRSRKAGNKPSKTHRAQRTDGVNAAIPHLPQIKPQLTHSQRLRFVCTTNGTQAITFANLLDSMIVAATSTTGYDIFDTVKVKFVEVWASPPQSNQPLTVTVDFAGGVTGAAGSGAIFQDTSMGVSPAHVKAIPSKRCAAAFYQGSSAFVAFSLPSCPLNAIIDVMVTFKNAAVAPVAAAQALVGAAAGQFYYRGLDGLPVASTKFPTVDFEAI